LVAQITVKHFSSKEGSLCHKNSNPSADRSGRKTPDILDPALYDTVDILDNNHHLQNESCLLPAWQSDNRQTEQSCCVDGVS